MEYESLRRDVVPEISDLQFGAEDDAPDAEEDAWVVLGNDPIAFILAARLAMIRPGKPLRLFVTPITDPGVSHVIIHQVYSSSLLELGVMDTVRAASVPVTSMRTWALPDTVSFPVPALCVPRAALLAALRSAVAALPNVIIVDPAVLKNFDPDALELTFTSESGSSTSYLPSAVFLCDPWASQSSCKLLEDASKLAVSHFPRCAPSLCDCLHKSTFPMSACVCTHVSACPHLSF